MWGQENWQGGVRKWGERGRKLQGKSQGDLLHTFIPSLCFLFCQFFRDPKKTLRSCKNAHRVGTTFMPRLFKQYIHSCFDWFHVILNALGCFNTILDPTSLENVRCVESYGKFLFYLIGCQHDPPFESAPVAFIMQLHDIILCIVQRRNSKRQKDYTTEYRKWRGGFRKHLQNCTVYFISDLSLTHKPVCIFKRPPRLPLIKEVQHYKLDL